MTAAGLAAYHNSLRGVFVMDDSTAIVRNATIRTLVPPWGALSPPKGTPVTGRPVVNLSLAMNYAIGGLHVESYHAFNLATHVLAALVLFGIVRRTLAAAPNVAVHYRDPATWIAAAAALLWVVHPLTSESVDYTIQRTELLMGLFFLLTFYCALRSFQSPERRIWQVAALAAFALGMGCKEVIVVAPAVVLVYDRLFWSTSFRDALKRHRRLYASLGVVLVVCILLVATRFHGALIRFADPEVTPWEYALTQSGVIVHYLRLVAWPYPLVADYDGWPIARSVGDVLPSLIVLLALVGLTVWGLVRRQKLAFLGVFFFLVLAPTSSFRPMLTEIAAERRMYLPLAAAIVLIVLAGNALGRGLGAPRAAGMAMVTLFAAILGLVTVRRNEDYRTTLAFWSDIVTKRPDNPRARVWLGSYLDDHGRRGEALVHLMTAVRLQPRNATAQYDLGIVLAARGRTDEAIEHYREAVRIQPHKAEHHNNLGISLVNRGEIDEAIEHYREALRLDPRHVFARYNLGQALARQGRTEQTTEHPAEAARAKTLRSRADRSPASSGPP